MHFRILKMIATSGFLTALECTKFVFGHGPRRWSLQRSLRPPTWSTISKEMGRRGKEMERKEGEGLPLMQIPGSAPGCTRSLTYGIFVQR